MPTFNDFARGWLRRQLVWSNSFQSWQERVGFAVLFGGIVAAWYCSERLPLAPQVLLWLALLLVVAILLRRGWLSITGPMFYHDLVRTTRRSRFALYRCYAYFTLILVIVFWSVWYYWSPERASGRLDHVAFAQTFFYTFTILQLAMVALIAPAYTAGAIAEEKERRTLEYILATDLRNREIILSKLGTRLANLCLMILTGLPILSIVQFAGGVDPDLILAGFATTVLTAAGLASLGMLTSVYARKPRNAIASAYLIALAYLVLSWISTMLGGTAIAAWTLRIGSFSLSGAEVLLAFQSGSPLLLLRDVLGSFAFGGRFADTLRTRLFEFAEFQISVSVLCCVWAIARIRAVFLKHADGVLVQKRGRWRLQLRPRVGILPMIWKEFFIEGGVRFGWFGRILVGIIVGGTFWPLIADLVTYATGNTRTGYLRLPEDMYHYARVVGAFVACILLLGVALRASTSISSEREKQTLDGLLTTPLGVGAILGSKWLAAVFTIRWGWIWLLSIWGLGVYSGGLHIASVAYLLLAWLVYSGLLATLGLWFSLTCRSSTRASIFTLFSAAGFGMGIPLLAAQTIHLYVGRWQEWISRTLISLSPPAVLGYLFAIPRIELRGNWKESWEIRGACAGLLFWAAVALGLWALLYWRFRKDFCRKIVRPSNPQVGEIPAPIAIAPAQPI
jgi:ABC-type transport system involved in multi-copper enzyme maturation permease subunit